MDRHLASGIREHLLELADALLGLELVVLGEMTEDRCLRLRQEAAGIRPVVRH